MINPLAEEFKDIPALIGWITEQDAEVADTIYILLRIRLAEQLLSFASKGDTEATMVLADKIHTVNNIREAIGLES